MRTIWMLRRRSYPRGNDTERAYANVANAKDDMYNDMNTEYMRGSTDSCIVRGDNNGVLYSKDGKVRFDWTLSPCELNEESEPFAGPDEDKFYLRDGSFKWCYFNPNGYGEKGQYVENNLTNFDVLEGVRQGYDKEPDDFFWTWLSQEARQYLYDNDGSDEFFEFDRSFRDDPCDLIGCSEETMKALMKWANGEQ